MHTLIIAGEDVEEYVYKQGVRMNFITTKALDEIPSDRLNTSRVFNFESEMHNYVQYANDQNKGLCFITKRVDVIEAILKYFQYRDSFVELIKCSKNGVEVFQGNDIINHI